MRRPLRGRCCGVWGCREPATIRLRQGDVVRFCEKHAAAEMARIVSLLDKAKRNHAAREKKP